MNETFRNEGPIKGHPDISKLAYSIVLDRRLASPDLVEVVEYATEEGTAELAGTSSDYQENSFHPADIAYQTRFDNIGEYDSIVIDVFSEHSTLIEKIGMKGGLALNRRVPNGTLILNYGFMLDDTITVMESIQGVNQSGQAVLVEMIRDFSRDSSIEEAEAQKIRNILETVQATLS